MGWRNNNLRKQILKAFFLKSIREILIMIHVIVVFGKKLIYRATFRLHLDITHSQEIDYAALICVSLAIGLWSLWVYNRLYHSLTYTSVVVMPWGTFVENPVNIIDPKP